MASRHLGLDHMGYTHADGTGETLSFFSLVISFPHTPTCYLLWAAVLKWVKKYELQGEILHCRMTAALDETQKKKFDFVALFFPSSVLFSLNLGGSHVKWPGLRLMGLERSLLGCQEENSLTTPVAQSPEQSTGTRYKIYIHSNVYTSLTQMFPVV